MEDSKALDLFREIQEKTQSRKLNWQPTALENVFLVPIKGEYVLKAFSFTDNEGGEEHGPPSFTLFERDEIILDITVNINGVEAPALTNLFRLVKRQALKTDEKLDNILSELKKL